VRYSYSPRSFSLREHGQHLAAALVGHRGSVRSALAAAAAAAGAAPDAGCVHFVTHCYGALVLRAALQRLDWSHTRSRVVMLAPPNRGAQAARAVWRAGAGLALLGHAAGAELGTRDGEWFDEHAGALPPHVSARIVAGTLGCSPLLSPALSAPPGWPWLGLGLRAAQPAAPAGSSSDALHDGRVTVAETRLPSSHELLLVPSPHGLLPMHPAAIGAAVDFLAPRHRKPPS
jgi:hypothetical protein